MNDSDYATRPNKSQLKREIRVLNELGKELVSLPDSALKKMPLSDVMQEAVRDGKRFSRGALQRQLRRIVSLMQGEDIDAIKLELARHKQPAMRQTAQFHQTEQWRDRLVSGDERLLTELIDRFINIDRQYVRQLVRNARHEAEKNRSPKSARNLFHYLAELQRTSQLQEENNDEREQ